MKNTKENFDDHFNQQIRAIEQAIAQLMSRNPDTKAQLYSVKLLEAGTFLAKHSSQDFAGPRSKESVDTIVAHDIERLRDYTNQLCDLYGIAKVKQLSANGPTLPPVQTRANHGRHTKPFINQKPLDSMDVVVVGGRHSGKTVREILDVEPEYIRLLWRDYKVDVSQEIKEKVSEMVLKREEKVPHTSGGYYGIERLQSDKQRTKHEQAFGGGQYEN